MINLRRPRLEEIPDENIRQSLQWLFDYLTTEVLLLSEFKHFEIEFNKAETELLFPHNLAFLPKDIIVTSLTGGNTVSFVYEKFTNKNLVITTSGPCVVRFLAGRYEGA